MRFLCVLLPLTFSLAQEVRILPPQPVQGETLRVYAKDAVSARLGDRSARFFSDGESRLALLPVPVLVKPGPVALELLGASGEVILKKTVVIRDARFRRQNVTLGKETAALQPAPGDTEIFDALRKTVSDRRYWSEPFAPPVPGCLTSPFGVLRMHNGQPTGSYHGGLDQRGAAGTPVRAVAAGVVRIVRMFNLQGGTVGLDHGQGVTSTYLHMSAFNVKEGAEVKKGDVVGRVGSTGRSSAPHLHWGIAVNGYGVNPSQWVRIPACAARPKARR